MVEVIILGSSILARIRTIPIIGSGKKREKSDYCWNYNKGVKCKYGPKCKFIEWCSYCDSSAHHLLTCPKVAAVKKTNDGGDHHNQSNGQSGQLDKTA